MPRSLLLGLALIATLACPSVVHADKAPSRRLAVARAELPPVLTVERVVEKINSVYMAPIQRCYRKALALDPSLHGSVMLAFAVAADGSVRGSAAGFADEFDGCISAAVKFWRFGPSAKPLELKISLVLAGA
jgi:hypothetical protein